MPKRTLLTIAILQLVIALGACDGGETSSPVHSAEYTEEGVIDYLNQLPPEARARIFRATGVAEAGPSTEPAAPPPEPATPEPATPEPVVDAPEPEPPAPEVTAEPIPGVDPQDRTTPVSTITAACAVGLNRLLLTRTIENREPVGAEPPFAATAEPIYVYMDLANINGPENQVEITWVHVATNHAHQQSMDVGVSPNWRTWVRHQLGASRTGRWIVSLEVDGCVIGTIEFDAVAGM